MAALVACPYDGKQLDPDLDHNGRPHGGARRVYCTVRCRRECELARRRQQRAAASAERRRTRTLEQQLARQHAGEHALPGLEPAAPA